MCVCVYMCVYVCMCVHVYVCVYVYVCMVGGRGISLSGHVIYLFICIRQFHQGAIHSLLKSKRQTANEKTLIRCTRDEIRQCTLHLDTYFNFIYSIFSYLFPHHRGNAEVAYCDSVMFFVMNEPANNYFIPDEPPFLLQIAYLN